MAPVVRVRISESLWFKGCKNIYTIRLGYSSAITPYLSRTRDIYKLQISKLLVVATHIYILPELLLIASFRLLGFGGETLYVQGWLRYIRYGGNSVSGFPSCVSNGT